MNNNRHADLDKCPICHNKLEATVPFFLDVTILHLTPDGYASIDAWSPMGSSTIEESGDFDSSDVRVYCPNDHTLQQMIAELNRTNKWDTTNQGDQARA